MSVQKPISVFIFLAGLISLSACGGGSSESGVLLEGQLTQGEVAAHSAQISFRHSADEPIEEVQVCALGECSRTDGKGQWGFVAPEGFSSGEILMSIQGHGIDTQTAVNIPSGANDVFLHLQNKGESGVIVHHMMVNGEEVHAEGAGHGESEHDDSGHSEEAEHDHSEHSHE